MVDIAPFVRTDFKAVDKREALHSVKGWLTGDASRLPIIVDAHKTVGLVNERALMTRHMDLNAHLHQFALLTRAVAATASIDEATNRMAELRTAYLPVDDERGRLIGYVAALDLARGGPDGGSAIELSIPVTNLREKSTVSDALHAFAKEYVEFLPVLSADGRLTGALSRSSILRVEFDISNKGRKDSGGEKLTILHDPVSGFMDPAPVLLAPSADFGSLVDALDENGYAFVGSNGHALNVVTSETLFQPRER